MKTIKATMPLQTNQNSWAVKLSANISKDEEVVKDFIRHPLFKDFFIREAGVFAPENAFMEVYNEVYFLRGDIPRPNYRCY